MYFILLFSINLLSYKFFMEIKTYKKHYKTSNLDLIMRKIEDKNIKGFEVWQQLKM